jgi:hypothetical protein
VGGNPYVIQPGWISNRYSQSCSELDTGRQEVMSEALLSQRTVRRVIGQSRLQRLLHAGWLKPVKRTAHSVLFSPRDIHLALSRAEREACPPDRIEVARVRASEVRNGHPRVRKVYPQPPGLDAMELDFSAFDLSNDHIMVMDDGDQDDQDLAML